MKAGAGPFYPKRPVREREVLENYGVITAKSCAVYGGIPCGYEGGVKGETVDELMLGWLVRTVPVKGSGRRDWLRVTTHYGYEGYVRAANVRWLFWEEYGERRGAPDHGSIILAREGPEFRRIVPDFADVLCGPRVQAPAAATLCRNSVVRILNETEPGGWSLVRCADGCAGYVRSAFLLPRLDDDEFFLRGNLLRQKSLRALKNNNDVEGLRKSLVDTAFSYLGTQYRWGGKGPAGVDCSGFVFLCYMENGVLIYRDADIRPGYPVRGISREALRPGDLIYWEGHVAMYIGDEKYIHATGNAESPCVTVNSLRSGDCDYRADLADTVKAYGSVF